MMFTVNNLLARFLSNRSRQQQSKYSRLSNKLIEDQECVATIIIPVRVAGEVREPLKRLRRLLHLIPFSFEIIVVDDGSTPSGSALIRKCVNAYPRSQYFYLPTGDLRFSLARARNYGAKYATADIVVFHDLDFLGTYRTYLDIIDRIHQMALAEDFRKFFCIPVAFLTNVGTRQYMRFFQKQPNAQNPEFFRQTEHDHFLKFLVLGSSCIVVFKNHFLEMGGHDETYDGHGAEDFELLHRLSKIYPIAPRPPGYEINMGSGAIKEYRGFRAYFALYGKDCEMHNCVLVHLYHPKRLDTGYYQHERNFAKLKSLMISDNGSYD